MTEETRHQKQLFSLTWTTIRENTRLKQSWSRNRLFISLTSWTRIRIRIRIKRLKTCISYNYTFILHLERLAEMRNVFKFCLWNLKSRNHCRDLDIHGKTWKKQVVIVWTGLNWFRIGSSAWTCQYGNEASASIERWEVL